MKRKRCKKPNLSQRIEALEMAIASMREEFSLMTVVLNAPSLVKLCESVQFCETSINSMVNNLQGIEVAVSKLIPKETLEKLPQFRDVFVLNPERAQEIREHLL